MNETQSVVQYGQVKGNAFLKNKVKINILKFVDMLFLKLLELTCGKYIVQILIL